MALTLQKVRMTAGLRWDMRNVTPSGTPSDAYGFSYARQLTDGVGAGLAKNVYHNTHTVAPSGNLVLRLTGSLLDAFGNVLNFTKVKGVYFELAAGGASAVTVGGGTDGAGANAFPLFTTAAAKQQIRSGGVKLLAANDGTGYPVTAGTGDALRFDNLDAVNAATLYVAVASEV